MVNINNVTPSKGELRRERFEFVLTINNSIVCQRYFKINKLRKNALISTELVDTLNYCVNLIQRDLRNKSNLYNIYTAPQIFNNREECDEWMSRNKLEPVTFVLIKDTEEVFVWSGEKLELFDKRFNTSDYVEKRDEIEGAPYTLCFTFIDNGKDYMTKENKSPIYSRVWDGTDYPKFIRGNIDLSNSKNKFNMELRPFDAVLVNLFNKGREDLVSRIIDEICDVCSDESIKYTTTLTYGDKVYSTNVR